MNTYVNTSTVLMVKFPATKAGLSTVGYQLKDSTGANVGSRVTAGVVNNGVGYFSSAITFATAQTGSILWDTGEGSPLYASEEFNVVAVPLAASGYTAPPTASDIATAVWGSATRSLTTFGSLVADIVTAVWGATVRTLSAFGFTVAATVADKTGYSLAITPPTAAQIDTQLTSTHGTGSWTADVAGSGSILTKIIVSVNNILLDNVAIYATTDIYGNNVVAGTLYTDTFGEVSFMLDPGVYYIWKHLSGYNFTNPETITVTA